MADVGFKPKSWYLSLPALLATKEVAYQVIPNKRQILSFTMWSVREGCSEKSPPVPSINQKSNLSCYNCITWSIMHASWWASLVAQTVKNLPATRETWVQSLGQEDPPGEGHGNPLQYSYLKNSMDRGDWWAAVHGVTKSWTDWAHTHTHTHTSTYKHLSGPTLWNNMSSEIVHYDYLLLIQNSR